jgi:hypothetical protein
VYFELLLVRVDRVVKDDVGSLLGGQSGKGLVKVFQREAVGDDAAEQPPRLALGLPRIEIGHVLAWIVKLKSQVLTETFPGLGR